MASLNPIAWDSKGTNNNDEAKDGGRQSLAPKSCIKNLLVAKVP